MQDGKDDSFFADGLVGRILTYQIDISIYIYPVCLDFCYDVEICVLVGDI